LAGYFGTEAQIRLQRRADELYHWVLATPGYCNAGRLVAIDDLDKAGWEAAFEILERDAAVGFRLLPTQRVAEVMERFTARGCRVDTWDTFTGDAETALPAARAIVAGGVPEGLAPLALPRDPEHESVRRIQAFMAASGVMPFSGSMLTGAFGPAVTLAFTDAAGEIAAAAHTYFSHNAYSPHRRAAWGGLVTVAPALRGRGLGRYVNACMVAAAFEQLGAESVYEFVVPTNAPSRRMVKASGLRLDPARKGVAATPPGERFTR
jgi:RimJ/RimL family protein N-acetyltransferase